MPKMAYKRTRTGEKKMKQKNFTLIELLVDTTCF